eukprot:Colp12_sorted_trinity150504_noHs@29469
MAEPTVPDALPESTEEVQLDSIILEKTISEVKTAVDVTTPDVILEESKHESLEITPNIPVLPRSASYWAANTEAEPVIGLGDKGQVVNAVEKPLQLLEDVAPEPAFDEDEGTAEAQDRQKKQASAPKDQKAELIVQVLEMQNTVNELAQRVAYVREQNTRLKSHNSVLAEYTTNLLASSGVFKMVK